MIAIFGIVVSHVVQTLGTNYGYGTYNDYVIVLGNSTRDITTFILNLLRYLGGIGNDIFFISTAWFMVDKQPRSKKKILSLIFDVWTISVIMLIFVIGLKKGNISGKYYIISSLFPVTLGTNWYITCYILFCFVHPYLNLVINISNKHKLFRIVEFMTMVYIVINYFLHTAFFASRIIIWIAIYFLIAYCKKYVLITNSIKFNLAMLAVGLFGNTAVILLTNYFGFKLDILSDKLLYWHQNSSPFIIMISFALFNIFRQFKFKSRIINNISSLSLYVYLIHGNSLLNKYCSSTIWHKIFIQFGLENVLFWVFIYSLAFFALVVAISTIYKKSVHKMILCILDTVYPFCRSVYLKAEDYLMLMIR